VQREFRMVGQPMSPAEAAEDRGGDRKLGCGKRECLSFKAISWMEEKVYQRPGHGEDESGLTDLFH
jgi:hypothetical protein